LASRKNDRPSKFSPSAVSAAAPVKPSVFNFAGLTDRMLGDEGFVTLVLDSFEADLPHQIEMLEESLDAGNPVETARDAHAIQGSAANIGGEELQSIAREMEKAISSSDLDTVRNAMDNLKSTAK
jgi:HPt (histidine-containing phosphotransfer) domain-containing protein